ncbi:MAG: hypothetical protein WBV26_03825 [Candidatus Sulfotelmatobacter sp.]|jgi:hypothetical protein
MKEIAILLLLAVMVNGCGSSSAVQTPSGSVWQSAMSGGVGTSSGFSFNTQFTVSSNGALSISSFQFLNQDTCFGTVGPTPTGTLNVTFNSADQVTGTFSFTIPSGNGDTVTLKSTSVTGTVNTSNYNTLSGGIIVGTWALAPGSGSSCVAASGPFTMTQTGT